MYSFNSCSTLHTKVSAVICSVSVFKRVVSSLENSGIFFNIQLESFERNAFASIIPCEARKSRASLIVFVELPISAARKRAEGRDSPTKMFLSIMYFFI